MSKITLFAPQSLTALKEHLVGSVCLNVANVLMKTTVILSMEPVLGDVSLATMVITVFSVSC